jgi:threonine dehydratase
VQAERASAAYDSWRSGRPVPHTTADTFADGLATRNIYEMTFGPLRDGLAGFVTVSESAMADAVRIFLSATHNLAEGAGAAGLAGAIALREQLAGKRVAIVLSGGNIDRETLRRVVDGEID